MGNTFRRIRFLLRRRRAERDLRDELEFHREQIERQEIASGQTLEAARFAARRRLGRESALRADARAVWRIPVLETLWADLRLGVRSIGRSRMYAIAVVVAIGIGVGLNLVAFSIVDALLFRPPVGVRHGEALRRVVIRFDDGPIDMLSGTSFPLIQDLQADRASVAAAAAWVEQETGVGRGIEAQTLKVQGVTANFFEVLGAVPHLGRLLESSDDSAGMNHDVAVLSYGWWRRTFGADSTIIGRSLWMNHRLFTVVGVAERGFSGATLEGPAFWVPLTSVGAEWVAKDWATSPVYNQFRSVVRLISGAVGRVVEARGTARLRREQTDLFHREPTGVSIALLPMPLGRSPETRYLMLRPTTVVAVACIVVLLATCLSVANLLIARLIGRQHEWTVRRALGAGPMQLAKAMLVDSLVLLMLGAGLAALVARLAVPVALWLFLPNVDPDSVRLSVRYLGWGTGLTLFAALLAVVAPAVAMIRRIGNTGLAVGARPVEEVRPRVRAGLVAAQLAIAVTLFGTAALVVRSLVAVKQVDPGFDVSHVLFVRADLRHSGFSPTVSERTLETVRDRVSRLPGVRAVSLFRGGTFTVFSSLIARIPPAPFPRGIGAEGPFVNEVDSAFFIASGLRLLRGRVFRSNEHFADRVAIANEALIKTFWPRGLPATPRLEMLGELPSVEIVGVVANSPAFRVAERPVPMLYLPLHPGPGSLESSLLVRTAGLARDAVASVRSVAVSAAPDLAGVDIQPMADIMAPEFRTWQTASLVTTGFAAIALGLSVVAIFGLLTYLIRARTFEFGVRITLGADAKDIALLVGRGVAGMALLGVASGGVGAWMLGRLGQALLFGVSPADPVSLIAAAGCGMLAAVGASLVPVWHATRISPIGALRSEQPFPPPGFPVNWVHAARGIPEDRD